MDTSQIQQALGSILSELESLRRSNASLVERNDALEREMATLRTGRAEVSPRPAPEIARTAAAESHGQTAQGGVTSRRTWLKRAAGAAVASVAAGAMLQRDTDIAAAHHGTYDSVYADRVIAHSVYVQRTASDDPTISATATNGHTAALVVGNDATSLVNSVGAGTGVHGQSRRAAGVKGVSYENVAAGVHGIGSPGVKGESNATAGYGVHGVGWAGVDGESTTLNWAAVAGEHKGTGTGGPGVSGLATSTTYGAAQGVNKGTGPGVKGSNYSNTGDGVLDQGKVGVRGKSSIAGAAAVVGEHSGSGTTSGYGGQFKGARAQVRLVPAGAAGRPTSGTHAKGELYLDSAATLYVCTVGGTPGTWRRLTTTTA